MTYRSLMREVSNHFLFPFSINVQTEKVEDFQAVYYVAIYGVLTSFDKERLMLLIGFSTNCLMVSWLKD